MATRLIARRANMITESFVCFFSAGETVNKDEQINLHETDETLPTAQSSMSLSTVASSALSPATSVAATVPVGNPLAGLDLRASVNADEWEKERTALYQQLDEKVIGSRRVCPSRKSNARCALRQGR